MIAYIDMFLIALTAFSIGMGFYRGFIWELFKYLALLIALIAAAMVLSRTYHLFAQSEYVFIWLAAIGLSVFFLISSTILYLVHKISLQIKRTAFAMPDRLLGSILGCLRAYLLAVGMYSGVMLVTSNHKPDWLKQSTFDVHFAQTNLVVQSYLKKHLNSKLSKILKLDKLLANSTAPKST